MTGQQQRGGGPDSQPTRDLARQVVYAPNIDGDADPGEIVWTWVPYEEDPDQGKDRPVLVVGRHARLLLGLMLSSNQRHRDHDEWMSLGSGAWDYNGRESFVRLDRVLVVQEKGIRREGSICEPAVFAQVADRLRGEYGWR